MEPLVSSVSTLSVGNHFHSCYFTEICIIPRISFRFLKLKMSKTELLKSPQNFFFSTLNVITMYLGKSEAWRNP